MIFFFKEQSVKFDQIKENFIAAFKRISWLSKDRKCRVKAVPFQELHGLCVLWCLFVCFVTFA